MDVIDGSEIGAVPSSRSDLAGNGCESVENGRLENSTPLLRLGVLRKMFHRLEAAESLLGGAKIVSGILGQLRWSIVLSSFLIVSGPEGNTHPSMLRSGTICRVGDTRMEAGAIRMVRYTG